ncbi:signal peptidase I [Arthrobacter sp. NPDC056727]|uniref:signal peptidase I n=1 Tax=Arthrobacter sp. NPDC056727 TaxID=3345927 RepID=UPI00366C0ACE
MGKAVTPEVPQRTGRDFGGRRGGGAATRIFEIRRRKRFAAAGRWVNLAVLLFIFLTALALIAIPQATGSRTYSVLSNSMEPTYSAGTFLVVKPAALSQLKYGDLVTYRPAPDSPEVLTHRIVGFGATQNGERTLVTKGDNAAVNDAEPVQARQIMGKPLYAVPLAGYLASALGEADRDLLIMLAVAGLAGQCLLLIYLGARRRRRAR